MLYDQRLLVSLAYGIFKHPESKIKIYIKIVLWIVIYFHVCMKIITSQMKIRIFRGKKLLSKDNLALYNEPH